MTPLAEPLRPQRLEDFVGQEHILGPVKPLPELARPRSLVYTRRHR